MAERRMFAKTIIDSDAFIDMPVTARLLYYDLSMRADDDGFVNSPKKIMRMIGASEDDLRILAGRKFIIPFDSGIVVIKHWKIHNYIRKDTYKETTYKEEKAQLSMDENNAYTTSKPALQSSATIPSQVRDESVDEPSTQVSIGKASQGKEKDRLGVENAVATLGDEVLSEEDYNTLLSEFPKSVVDYKIKQVVTHPYLWCLNLATLRKWCGEFSGRLNDRKAEGKKTAFDDFDQRNYDYDQLEKNWLNQGKEVQA